MTDSPSPPPGSIRRESNRVMNLSHFLRQAARRHGEDIGFV